MTVLIADGCKLLAESLAVSLGDWPNFAVVDEYPTTGLRAVESASRHRPDVVLLDYWIREMEGPVAVAMIRDRVPDTKVLLLTGVRDPHARRGLAAGAVGCVPKSVGVDEVAAAVYLAGADTRLVETGRLGGPQRFDPPEDLDVGLRRRLVALSPREIRVLRLTYVGCSPEAIARQFSISPSTVRVHLHNAIKKLEAESKEQALALARSSGLITI